MLKMLVTRPEPDASETAARLRALGIEPVIAPLLVQHVEETSLPDPAGFAAIAVTSANALRALAERGELVRYAHLRLFAVGDKTAALARELGFADVTSAEGNFGMLVEKLAHAGLTGPIWYPAAREQAGDLARSLAPFGLMVITSVVYRMDAVVPENAKMAAAITDNDVKAALLYSKRASQAFVSVTKALKVPDPAKFLTLLCLSENVAQPLVDAHFVRIGLADHPSEEAMLALALSFARDQNPA